MITVVVVIHLLVAMVMIGLILLQKTEGNASGGGFSGQASLSMMQPRARPNPLSRATVVMGIAFFATSIGLALLSKQNGPAPSLFVAPSTSGPQPKVNDIRQPSAPTSSETPAAP